MVAVTYGSRLLLSIPSVDVNRRWRPDATTALQYAASGGLSSPLAVEVAGADADASGCRPADLICSKIALQDLYELCVIWMVTTYGGFHRHGPARAVHVQNSQGEAAGLADAPERRALLVSLEE
jgi:hypothetical protein